MTSHWHFDDVPSKLQRAEIAAALTAGKVLLLPTDTIYGLHAAATNAEAVGRIAEIKGREETKPFIVLASSIEQFASLGVSVEPRLLEALSSLWPAPLTAILPLRAPLAASRGASSLAIRIPALRWLRDLIAETGPLVSTSANRSGEPPIDTPAALAHDLQTQLDGIADKGRVHGQPSAILDLTLPEPRFLREGEESFTQKVWKTLRKSL